MIEIFTISRLHSITYTILIILNYILIKYKIWNENYIK